MAELTANQRVRLLLALADANALDSVQAAQHAIMRLQVSHGATVKRAPTTNTLRCAGVTATCTWSADTGLLKAWRNNANKRLGIPALEGTAHG